MRRQLAGLALLSIALAAGSLATGWVEVAPGEVVVVRRLGRLVPAPWLPGPHLGWPVGLDRRTQVRTDEVRRLEVGIAGTPGPRDDPGSGEYLTGDRNLIRARGVVQYRVSDPVAFVLRTAEVDPILGRLTEACLARELSRRPIDAALRLDRAAISEVVATELSRLVASHRLGIAILGVSLTDARPPGEVAPDFAAAQAAQSDRDRRGNEAKSYAGTTRTAANAEAQARIQRARAHADRAVVVARSSAGSFLALLAEADRARPLTVRRLYFDALKELWPRVRRKLIMTPEESIDLSILGGRISLCSDRKKLTMRTLQAVGNLGIAVIFVVAAGVADGRAAERSAVNPAELAGAIKGAKPGDTIVMADGPWRDTSIDFNATGEQGLPITLRARTPGKVVLGGSSLLKIGGTHLVVDGLHFTGEGNTPKHVVEFRRDSKNPASHCRMTNCAIIDDNPPDKKLETHWVSLHGEANRVDHCYFAGKTNGGTTLVVWVGDVPNRHRIDFNHFGPRPRLGVNGGETIRVGDSRNSMKDSRTLVENNYFEKCDGEIEAISNKSCENIYRHNTFVECSATLCLRHGNRCTVEGNFFLGNHARGSGGVRIIGEGHRVINNYLSGLEGDGARSAISLMNGMVDSPLSGYFQVNDALVAFNTLVDNRSNLAIGVTESERNTLPPRDCSIANNLVVGGRAPLVRLLSEPIRLKWEGNLMGGAELGIPPTSGINVADPQLVRGEGGLMRPSGTSPALGAAVGEFAFVREDIDGQPRTGHNDVGSDQRSDRPILHRPLTPDDVGPSWLRGSTLRTGG